MEIAGLIFSILGAIGGVLWLRDHFRRQLRRRAFWALFSLKPSDRIIIVVPTGGKCGDRDSPDCSPSPTPNVITTLEDSMARATVLAALMDQGFRPDLRFHSALTQDDLAQNLVLICGPAGNCVSRDLFLRRDIPHHFAFQRTANAWSIVDANGQAAHAPTDGIALDHAILAKYPNPWASIDAPRSIYLVAGTEGLGTWGAAHVLATRCDLLIRYLTAPGRGPKTSNFSALVSVRRNGTASPTIDGMRVKSW